MVLGYGNVAIICMKKYRCFITVLFLIFIYHSWFWRLVEKVGTLSSVSNESNENVTFFRISLTKTGAKYPDIKLACSLRKLKNLHFNCYSIPQDIFIINRASEDLSVNLEKSDGQGQGLWSYKYKLFFRS